MPIGILLWVLSSYIYLSILFLLDYNLKPPHAFYLASLKIHDPYLPLGHLQIAFLQLQYHLFHKS